MTGNAAFWVFAVGTVSSSALFLALTFDTHRQIDVLSHADRLDDQVVAGKLVFERHNCNDCHTILGFGGYYAPDLTRVVARMGEQAVRWRVKSPELACADSWRKMPRLSLTDAEIGDLLAFLAWVGNVENNDWPPQDAAPGLTRAEARLVAAAALSPGAAVFKERCVECHALGGAGGRKGPPLDRVGSRMTAARIRAYTLDPESVNPDAWMPKSENLSAAEADAVAAFLAELR